MMTTLHTQLTNKIRADLQQPLRMLKQVEDGIISQYTLSTAEFERFFAETYPNLEETQADLIFSPQFTPTQKAKEDILRVLGTAAMSSKEVDTLIQELESTPITATFSTIDEQCHATVTLHPVFIERYVNLLPLNQPLPDLIKAQFEPLRSNLSPCLNLIGRDRVWQSPERQQLFVSIWNAFPSESTENQNEYWTFLTDVVRTYRPGSLNDLHRQLNSLALSCEEDMNQVAGRTFQHEEIRLLHGQSPQNKEYESQAFARYEHQRSMAEKVQALLPVPV